MKITILRHLGSAGAALTLALTAGLLPAQAHAVTLVPVGSGIDISTSFSPVFQEASGLGLAKNEDKLWSVSDETFTMYKMNLDGSAVTSFIPTPASGVSTVSQHDFEGVTYAPPPPGSTNDHYIYLANEANNSILPVNYDSLKYHQQKTLSSMQGYNSVQCQGSSQTVAQAFASSPSNNGLEGITWDGDLSSFFVLKEKSPGLLIQINQALTQILACKVLTFSGADYSDVSYDPTRHLFWVVSDEAEEAYLYNWTSNAATLVRSLGYPHAEGISYDPTTNQVYIVTDNGMGQDSFLYTYDVQ